MFLWARSWARALAQPSHLGLSPWKLSCHSCCPILFRLARGRLEIPESLQVWSCFTHTEKPWALWVKCWLMSLAWPHGTLTAFLPTWAGQKNCLLQNILKINWSESFLVVLSIQEAVEREWTHSKTLCSSVSSCLCYVGVSLKLKKIMKVSQRICHLLCAGREQSCASTIFVLD